MWQDYSIKRIPSTDSMAHLPLIFHGLDWCWFIRWWSAGPGVELICWKPNQFERQKARDRHVHWFILGKPGKFNPSYMNKQGQDCPLAGTTPKWQNSLCIVELTTFLKHRKIGFIKLIEKRERISLVWVVISEKVSLLCFLFFKRSNTYYIFIS